MSTQIHRKRRFRWYTRVLLGIPLLVLAVVGGALAFVHTNYGRETVREQVQAQLDNVFVGGGRIGKIEGSPLGELVIHDVVVNGPDGKPAITAGLVHIRLKLVDLVLKRVRVARLIAERVDVALNRGADGQWQISGLLKPRPETTSSWNIDLGSIELRQAHVRVDSGQPDLGVINLDDVDLIANAKLPAHGVRTAGLRMTATWRERGAPILIETVVRDDGEVAAVRSLDVRVGHVTVTGSDITVRRTARAMPAVSGVVSITAKRADVAALVPRIDLPTDVMLAVRADADPIQKLVITGTLGPTQVRVDTSADFDTKRFIGTLSTGDFDLAALTRGKVVATAGINGQFDVALRANGELPVASIRVNGRGTYEDAPRSTFTLQATTRGQHISTTLDVRGAANANVRAELERVANAITLERGTLAMSIADPARATGGKAPVHGALEINLAAHGALTPSPALAVDGTVRGRRLRMKDLSIAALDLRIDATQLPRAPRGALTLRMSDIERADMQLRALSIDARNRADGTIEVEVSSRPKQDPWLVELAALVTPPARAGSPIVVDLQRHRIRAGNGVDWTGRTGRAVIGSKVIELRDLHSQSADGKISLAGSFARAGRNQGDLTAKLDVEQLSLAALRDDLAGKLDAHIDLARRAGNWRGFADVAGKQLVTGAQAPPVDVEAKLTALPGSLGVRAAATSSELGTASLALDVATPARLEDVAAWKRSGREVIRSAELRLQAVDLQRVSAVAGSTTSLAGRLDGTMTIHAGVARGAFEVRGIKSAKLRGIESIDADLAVAESGDHELMPTLKVKVAGVGNAVATARLALPERVLDPAAWQRLGVKALRGASVRTDPVTVDPAMLARLGITSTMRGRATLAVDVGAELETIKIAAVADDVRGTPIAKPVSIRVNAAIDRQDATASIAMTSQGKPITLLAFDGRVPLTIAKLRDRRVDLQALPIAGTLVVPKTSAPQLLGVFGRSEIVSGTLDGKVTVGGTIGKPTLSARLVGENLAVPTRRGRRIQAVKTIVVDATWKDRSATLKIDGVEDSGGRLSVVAEGDPEDLTRAVARVQATKFDTSPLLALAPGPAGGVEGSLDADLRVRGFDPRTAKIVGELHVRNARVPLAPAIGTLRRAQIDIAIRDHDIVLATTGKLGAGDVKVDGTIALDGVSLTGGQAKITLRKVSPIGAIEPAIDADITAKIARKGQQWTADVVVDHGFVKVSTTSGEKLKPASIPADVSIGAPKPQRPAPPGTPRPPERPAIVANIVLHPIKVESKEVHTTVHGKLVATADADSIGIVGTVEANSGDLDLFDRRYRIERAAVIFDGTIDPRLDVRITHDFPEVTTVTVVRDRLSKPELVLSSNPGIYTKGQLLGFLLGGEPNGDPKSGSARDKATSTGTSLVANAIGGYVRKALPFDIDVLRYEAATVGSSAAITVGTWLTHALFFAFRQHIDARPDENSGEGTIEYWLSQRLKVEGTAGDRGYDGVDVLWRKRF